MTIASENFQFSADGGALPILCHGSTCSPRHTINYRLQPTLARPYDIPLSSTTTATGKQGRVRSGATIQDEWESGYILSPLAGDDDDRGWTAGGGGDPT